MIYFISDVHLGFFERKQDIVRENLLIATLDKLAIDAEKIFIVGDLFDYWFEYKQVIPRYFYRILSKIHDLVSKGIKIEYVMGNHDFGHIDFFENEFGIKVHTNDIQRQIYGKRFYISHGDGKAYGDLGYKILKKILRHPFSLWLFMRLHPNFGIGLASGSSKKSRAYTDKKDYGKKDGMRDFALEKIEYGYDYVIMGHRHKAEITKHLQGYYINLGHWIKPPMTFGSFDGYEFNIIIVDEFLSNR